MSYDKYEEEVELALYKVTLLVEGDPLNPTESDDEEGPTLPLSIVIGGNARSTETLSFASSDVLQEDFEKTLNGMELYTYLFKTEDVGSVDNVEIGLDWSTRSSSSTVISLKSLQVTKQGGSEAKLVVDDWTLNRLSSSDEAEVSSFLCNKEISDRVGRRARFFDNLGNVPIESLIWGQKEDFVRVIDNIERVNSTTANLDQIIVGLPQKKRENTRLALDIGNALKDLQMADATDGKPKPEGGKPPQKRESTIKKMARRLSISRKARVSLDMQLGAEARKLGFNPRASISISQTDLNDSHIDQDRLSLGLKRIFEDCSEKNGIKECLLGCLCGVNTLLLFNKREEEEVKASVEFLSLLIKSKEEIDGTEQGEEGSVMKLCFQTHSSQVRLMDTSQLDEAKSASWFEGKYNNEFVVRKFLQQKLPKTTVPEPESTNVKPEQKVMRKASRQSLVNVTFSILGGALDEKGLKKVQQDSNRIVSFPGTLDDFFKTFIEWVDSYDIVDVEEQEGFLHSNIGFGIPEERENRLISMTKIVAFSCGKVEADICDAYVAISSSSAYPGKDFGEVKSEAYFAAQQDKIMSWLLSYHFFLEENADKQLYPIGNILANSSWFQMQMSELERRLEKQSSLLHTLSYSIEAIADPHSHEPVENARYYAYGDKVRSLLIDALTGDTNFEMTSESILSSIHVYLLNSRDPQESMIGSIKEFKPQECALSMGKDGTERKAGMKEIGILGLYVSDYEDHQNKFIQIGDSLIENLDALSKLKGFKVADLASLQPFKRHVWIDWPFFSNKMQALFEQGIVDCRKILQNAFEKWIALRLQNLYNVEIAFLKVRWNPIIKFIDQVKEVEALVKGLDTIVNVDLESTKVVLEALEDLEAVVSKHESAKKTEGRVSKSIQDTKEFLQNLQKLKEEL